MSDSDNSFFLNGGSPLQVKKAHAPFSQFKFVFLNGITEILDFDCKDVI